jgi:DNA-directed RNA polymerase subunit RPC12/RpoP
MTVWKCPICGSDAMMLTEEDETICCIADNCDFHILTKERAASEQS